MYGKATEVVPYKVEICKPLQFHDYVTNYNGPLRKGGTSGAYQFLATVLADVCYRMYAHVYPTRSKEDLDEKSRVWDKKNYVAGARLRGHL